MVEGLGVNFELLVRSSAKYANTFLSILHTLCQSDVPGVRMSAFALIGDLARKSPGLIEPGIPQLMQELIDNIDPTHPVSSLNNIYNNKCLFACGVYVLCSNDKLRSHKFFFIYFQ